MLPFIGILINIFLPMSLMYNTILLAIFMKLIRVPNRYISKPLHKQSFIRKYWSVGPIVLIAIAMGSHSISSFLAILVILGRKFYKLERNKARSLAVDFITTIISIFAAMLLAFFVDFIFSFIPQYVHTLNQIQVLFPDNISYDAEQGTIGVFALFGILYLIIDTILDTIALRIEVAAKEEAGE